MSKHVLLRVCVVLAAAFTATACSEAPKDADDPGLTARGTTMTTAKPARQDLTNRVSLAGKVTMNPVFGLVAPVGGQVRFVDVKATQVAPTKPTKVATMWVNGKAANTVEVPAGATFTGRLVDDRSTVNVGMPIVSAKHSGYGVVADIDAAQAYKISDGLASVQGQIKNGPGPFPCTVLGTIAALPAGTIPDPPAAKPDPNASPLPPGQGPPGGRAAPGDGTDSGAEASDPTGMRLVCTAPADVKLINGATATLEVITEKATNVLVVPVEAVAGSQGKGKVDVVGANGGRETRDVVLGLTDGKVIEVKSGLTGDETLAVPGPNLPPAKEGGENGPAGPGGPGGP